MKCKMFKWFGMYFLVPSNKKDNWCDVFTKGDNEIHKTLTKKYNVDIKSTDSLDEMYLLGAYPEYLGEFNFDEELLEKLDMKTYPKGVVFYRM